MSTAHSRGTLLSYNGWCTSHERTRRMSRRASRAVRRTFGGLARMADGPCAQLAASYAPAGELIASTDVLQETCQGKGFHIGGDNVITPSL